MINLNQDIQASYQIIQLIEKSKQNSELVIETLPDVFIVLDRRGQIYKANLEACRFLNLSDEQVTGYLLGDSFSPEHWRLIESGLLDLKEKEPKSFELSVVIEGRERIYLWSLSIFGEFPSAAGKLYTLQGRDITLLRLYQKKINDIFASIPLGILTVNSLGTIEDAFSEYTKWMLGQSEIAGRSLGDLLYEPSKELMDVATREGFKALMNSLNRSLREFDILAETFPKQFYYPLPHSIHEKGRYLGIKVQSIACNDRVHGLLIILEDRTAIVEAEQADEKAILLQDRSIERALQLKKADADLLEISIQDLTGQFHALGDSVMTQSSESFKNILHSIKANARLVGLTNLQKLAHSFETKLRDEAVFSWEVVYTNIETLLNEWREILALRKVLSSKEKEGASEKIKLRRDQSLWRLYQEAQNDPAKRHSLERILKDISKVELGTLESTLRGAVSKVCEPAGKRVKMLFDWDRDLRLDREMARDIRTCLVHVVNNAVDHGIESPLERGNQQKNPTGLVRVGSIRSKDGLIVFVEDDGRGLNRHKIQNQALERGIITSEQARMLSDAEIFDLIFCAGLSTADKLTDLSGRGVGLSAVREICQSYGGNSKITVNKDGMTRIELHFVLQE